jgi:hypothetical protein
MKIINENCAKRNELVKKFLNDCVNYQVNTHGKKTHVKTPIQIQKLLILLSNDLDTL